MIENERWMETDMKVERWKARKDFKDFLVEQARIHTKIKLSDWIETEWERYNVEM